jgi:hypothetical protein
MEYRDATVFPSKLAPAPELAAISATKKKAKLI